MGRGHPLPIPHPLRRLTQNAFGVQAPLVTVFVIRPLSVLISQDIFRHSAITHTAIVPYRQAVMEATNIGLNKGIQYACTLYVIVDVQFGMLGNLQNECRR